MGVIAMTVTLAATAAYLNNIEDVRMVKDAYTADFFALEGVNGVGITACEADSGLPVEDFGAAGDKVYCIQVYTENDLGLANMEATFGPAPVLLDGVFMNYKKIGVIGPQPGVTIGNN